jgi:hypothetical protein
VTEQEWLNRGVNFHDALAFLGPRTSYRKYRLFLAACARSHWPGSLGSSDHPASRLEHIADAGTPPWEYCPEGDRVWSRVFENYEPLNMAAPIVNQQSETQLADLATHWGLLHEIFGNLFRTSPIPSAWLAWNDGAIRKMAQAIYDERAFDRLPLLADALEDAGCDNADILAHCRSGREHVRGCWVVDLLLGKN